MKKIKINKEVAAMADAFAEREYETDGYEREWLSKGYYHGFMDAKNGATPEDKMMKAIFGDKYEPDPKPKETDIMFNNALDIITNLTDGDPEYLCNMVMNGEPDWCEKNCKSQGEIPKICLVKALKYYKKED